MSSRIVEVLTVRIGGDMDEVLEGLNLVGTKAQRLSRRMERTGKRLTFGVTLPLAGVGAAAFKMASEAEEASNKFNVVMGGAADQVRARLESLTSTIPLTTAEMERMSSGIQDMLVPMGVARITAAGMSADMVELAGDIGSFNDVLPVEVLEAMQSALAGQSEPMRRFGVDTRVTRLEALALEEGLIRQGEELNNTARAQAVMLAIQRDSADAMGDAARTIDSASNQMKFLGRNVKQLGLNIGAILLPVLTPLVSMASEATSAMAEMDPQLLQVGIAAGAAVAAIGPLVLIGSKLVGVFALLAAPTTGAIAGVLLGLTALATTAVVVWKNWDVLALKGFLAWTALKDAVFNAVSGILGALERLPLVGDKITELKDKFDAFAEESLAKANDRMQELERRINTNAVAKLGNDAREASREFEDMGNNATELVIPAVGALKEGLLESREFTAGLAENVRITVPAVEALARSGEEVVDKFRRLKDAIGDVALQGIDAFVDFASGAGDAIGRFVRRALTDLAKLAAKMLFIRGIMKFLPGVGSFLGFDRFVGGFATGGTIPAGSFGLVAEAGRPEIVSSPTFVQGPATVTPTGATMEPPAFVVPEMDDPIAYAYSAKFMRAFDAWWREWQSNGGPA